MAGVIGGVPRLPASSSKARMNRFNAGVGFKSSEQVTISGTLPIEVISSVHTDSTDLPLYPVNGTMILLISGDGSRRICTAFGNIWYEEVLTQMS